MIFLGNKGGGSFIANIEPPHLASVTTQLLPPTLFGPLWQLLGGQTNTQQSSDCSNVPYLLQCGLFLSKNCVFTIRNPNQPFFEVSNFIINHEHPVMSKLD